MSPDDDPSPDPIPDRHRTRHPGPHRGLAVATRPLAVSRPLGRCSASCTEPAVSPASAQPAALPQPAPVAARRRTRRRGASSDLKAIEEAHGGERPRPAGKLEAEIAAIRTDRAKLNAALIETAARVARHRGPHSARSSSACRPCAASEAAIRRSLDSRRGVIVEVLAALQRMGRRPPPAVLVRPEDMLEAVRDLDAARRRPARTARRGRDPGDRPRRAGPPARRRSPPIASALSGELAALAERAAAPRRAGRGHGRARLAEVESDHRRRARARPSELARQAGSLKELIDRMEREIAGARRAADEARRAAEAQARATRERFAAGGLPGSGAPRAQNPLRRGARAACRARSAATSRGISAPPTAMAERRAAFRSPRARRPPSSSPADGWVAFAGPVPVLWATLDHQCRRRLLSSCWPAWIRSTSRSANSSSRANRSRAMGEDVPRVAGSGSGVETNATGSLCRVQERRRFDRSGPWWAKSQSEKVRG